PCARKPRGCFPHAQRSLTLAEYARSVFAIALNFCFLQVSGVGAIVTAVRFRTCHHTFAFRVGALTLALSIHDYTSCPAQTAPKADARQRPLWPDNNACSKLPRLTARRIPLTSHP